MVLYHFNLYFFKSWGGNSKGSSGEIDVSLGKAHTEPSQGHIMTVKSTSSSKGSFDDVPEYTGIGIFDAGRIPKR
jgi:hypothetical protein